MKTPKNLGEGLHAFGGGLYLRVRGYQTGYRRLWFLRTTVSGRRMKVSIGPWPLISTAAARERAAEILLKIKSGEPIKELEPSRAKAPRLSDIWQEAIENQRRVKAWTSEKAAAQWVATFRDYVLPALGEYPVDEIKRDDVLRMLAPIWQSKSATAAKVRGRLETVLDYAKACGWRDGENPAAWHGNLALFLPARSAVSGVSHFEAVDIETLRRVIIPALWERKTSASLAVLFGCLTALRAGEFLRAEWQEIDGDIFTVPWIRMKTAKRSREDFRVPLSHQALLVLDAARGLSDSAVFPGRVSKFLAIDTPRITIQRLTGTAGTMHGMRSVFRDWAAAQGIDFTLAEKCLSHSVGDRTVQAYLRSDLLEERRAVLQQWADFILPLS